MSALPRKSRLKFKDRRAVSEILANILILGITVVLFSTVIGFVSTVPEPDDPVRVEMSATLDGDLLSITHNGGSTLQADPSITRVRIDADGIVRFVPLHFGTTSNGDPWDQSWSVGNTWFFNFTDNAVDVFQQAPPFEPSTVSVSVTYISQGNAIWSATLKTDADNPPRITNFRITGQNSSGTTIEFGDTVTLRVTVKDSDGDMDTVVGNLNSLFKENVPSTTFNRVGTEAWQVTITPTADNGSKIISITATDLNGNTDREIYQVSIVSPTVLPTISDDDDDDPPTPPPFDPDVPGGNPVEPPQFFSIDVAKDFFIYSRADWEFFKATVNPPNPQPAPNISEKRTFNVNDEVVLVFKTDDTWPGGSPSNNQVGKLTLWNPKLNPWQGQYVNTNSKVYTVVADITDPGTGVTTRYLETSFVMTQAMFDNGVKIFAEVTVGQDANAKTYQGYNTINGVGNPKVVPTTFNATQQNTLYYKLNDNMIEFRIFVDDGNLRDWRVHGGGPDPEYNFFSPGVMISNIGGQTVTVTTQVDMINYPNTEGNYFIFRLLRTDVPNNFLVSGWNALFLNVDRQVTDPGQSPLIYGHKFYMEHP